MFHAEEAGKRLDQFLGARLDKSRARVQQSISEVKVLVNDAGAKHSLKGPVGSKPLWQKDVY
jgi:ribosomal 50S subunit-recycling heat shock protein